ncbi:hypothetical protein FQA39_LY01740 [Lamprigera yunnana]|nr:hypothetical protein FQA39_LY01740 [Lamprigera yunnana]
MKMMQQNNEVQIQNRAIVERLDENSRIIQQMKQTIYELKQNLEATKENFRMEMKQNKEEVQRQLQNFLEEMNENWGKKYIEFDSKIVEVKEQTCNNSRRIDGICKGVAEQKNKLADVEAKINENREEMIQVYEYLKDRNKEIVNYVENKIKSGICMGVSGFESAAFAVHFIINVLCKLKKLPYQCYVIAKNAYNSIVVDCGIVIEKTPTEYATQKLLT